MEEPEISLEESFSLYQQGVLQLKNCGTILDEVEKRCRSSVRTGKWKRCKNGRGMQTMDFKTEMAERTAQIEQIIKNTCQRKKAIRRPSWRR